MELYAVFTAGLYRTLKLVWQVTEVFISHLYEKQFYKNVVCGAICIISFGKDCFYALCGLLCSPSKSKLPPLTFLFLTALGHLFLCIGINNAFKNIFPIHLSVFRALSCHRGSLPVNNPQKVCKGSRWGQKKSGRTLYGEKLPHGHAALTAQL